MGAWIEIIIREGIPQYVLESHPTMGAWIEIFKLLDFSADGRVAPHDGCVD